MADSASSVEQQTAQPPCDAPFLLCLKRGAETVRDCAITEVWFAPMSASEIEDYAASGEPMDKAGGYAIQGLASKYVEKIEGCYFNVMGLPIARVYRLYRGFKYLTNSAALPRSL